MRIKLYMAWVYLFAAALFQVGWMFSLKFLSFKKIGAIHWSSFFQNTNGIVSLLPLLTYIVFGAVNVYLLALAMKQITTSVAFAIWTAVSLVGVKLVEVIFYKEQFSAKEAFFLALIIIGIIGLKKA